MDLRYVSWDSTSPTNPIDLFVKYEDFLKSSKYTASLPWIRYSAFTDATLLRYYFWSRHILFSERWLSWKHCIVVFVAFFMWNALSLWILYVTAWLAHFENSKWISAPVQTMMSLSSSGQHFLLNEFQHKSKRGSWYIINYYFECTIFLNLPIEEVSQVWKADKELEAGTTLTDFDSLGSSVESSLLLLSLSGTPSSFGRCNFIFFLFEFL